MYSYTYIYIYIYMYSYSYIYIYIYIYICIRIHIHIYIYVFVFIFIYIYICIHIHIYIYIYVFSCIHILMHTYSHAYIFSCIHILMYTYIFIYTYSYIHIHIHIHIHTHTYTHTPISIYTYIHRCISKNLNIMEKVFIFCNLIFKKKQTFLYSRFIAHKLKYFKMFFFFYSDVTTYSLGKCKIQYLNLNIFSKINQKKIYKTEMFKISKVGLIMHSILGWGSICMNYCFNAAWHGGDQPVALLRRY